MFRPVHLAILELKRYFTNKGELAISIALPIVLFALVYGALGGEASFNATVNIVDLDGGEHARTLVERLEEHDELEVRELGIEEAEDALDRSAVLFVVVIPQGFTSLLEEGEVPRILFKQRGNGGETGQIVAAVVRDAVDELGSHWRVNRMTTVLLDGDQFGHVEIETAVETAFSNVESNPPVGTTVSTSADDEADVVNRLLPGILVMFLMFAVTLGSQTLVEERRGRTLERLMTTRLGINQLFIGKFLAGVFQGSLQAAILLSLAFVVLRVGGVLEFLQLVVMSVLVAFAVTSVGLLIGSSVRTPLQASWVAVFFTMFMTVFGGTFLDPGSEGPLFVLSKFTINHYAIDAMGQILSSGARIGEQLIGISVMLGVTLASLAAARMMFRVS